jgi:hypothetical protein
MRIWQAAGMSQDAPDSTAAHRAIADLIHGYAQAIRRGEAARCPAMFTQDGSFEVRQGDPRDPASMQRLSLAEGREAVGKHLAGSTSQVRMLPMIHNLIVEEIEGDRATSSCLMAGQSIPPGAEVIGEYIDNFRREAGQWLFSSRVFTMFRVAG